MAAEHSSLSKSAKYLKTLQFYDRKQLVRNIAFGIIFALVALVCQGGFNKFSGRNGTFLFLYIAISISAASGGFLAGIVTTLIGAIGADYLFLHPYRDWSLESLSFGNLALLIVFVIGGIVTSFAIENSRKTKELRLYKKRERELTGLVAQQELDLAKALMEVKSRDEFLSIASHELKTPLTSMLLQIQSILHSIKNVSLAQFSVQNLLAKLESAETQTVRLSKMINDLLNVSLITTGRFTLEKEKTDLTQIANEVLESFSDKLSNDKIKVNVKADKDIIGFWDRIRISQVVTNLINNAIKYGNGKPIEISIHKTHNKAEFQIKDKGIGMTDEQQEKIFTRFTRGDNAKEYVGLGVGLYITKQIVEAHGGTISVESYPEEGSTFTVVLPLSHKT